MLGTIGADEVNLLQFNSGGARNRNGLTMIRTAEIQISSDPVENAGPGFQLRFEALQFHPSPPGAPDGPRAGVIDWTHFRGVLLSLHFAQGSHHQIQGTAVMVAPGVALAASHVIQPWADAAMAGTAELACVGILPFGLIFWNVRQVTMVDNTDLTILSLSLGSALPKKNLFHTAAISTRLPAIGEKIFIGGFRAISESFEATEMGIEYAGDVHYAQGEITAVYPKERDRLVLPWPTVEVACSTIGGMSGGPAFDRHGMLIGLLSSSLDVEADDDFGPSNVSMLWPALTIKSQSWWPKGLFKQPISMIEMHRGLCAIDRPEAVVLETDPLTGVQRTVYHHWT